MNTVSLKAEPNAAAVGTWAIKVPVVITLVFWLIKMMATTVGETGADYLMQNLNFGLLVTTGVMSLALVGMLWAQFSAKRYVPWRYWLTVVLVSVVGTLLTDNLTDHLGVPLWLSTLGFSLALIAAFALWYAVERTLSIHSIATPRREAFYWATILLTFALGTAAGDWFAESVGLGFAWSAVAFGGAIAVITVGYFRFHWNAVLSFWLAYILTRPFGASMGDLLSQPVADGGLGLGTTVTSLGFLAAIILLVAYLTISRRDAPRAGD
ncbi:hypothetical protein [Halothiobacillus sp. DCM-1]|uniref:COG4705 family protein n=1 Tax=Halothiobacillus sp. DCM-1 TaxID=3112558 RepID=UPI00325624F8